MIELAKERGLGRGARAQIARELGVHRSTMGWADRHTTWRGEVSRGAARGTTEQAAVSTSRYVRTQPGGGGHGVIHRAECRMLTGAKHLEEWDWPEGKELEEVLANMRARGQDHFCRVCFRRRDDGR